MSRASIVIALVATFLIGASLGLMGGILFSQAQHRPRVPAWAERRGPGGGPGGSERRVLRGVAMLPRLRETLDLTDEQYARIEPLVLEAHDAMGAARDTLRARIERILTPEQRERMRKFEARRGFPGEPRGPMDRAHRAQPGEEGEPR